MGVFFLILQTAFRRLQENIINETSPGLLKVRKMYITIIYHPHIKNINIKFSCYIFPLINFKGKIWSRTGIQTRTSRSLAWHSTIELSWFLFQLTFKLSSWNVCHFLQGCVIHDTTCHLFIIKLCKCTKVQIIRCIFTNNLIYGIIFI